MDWIFVVDRSRSMGRCDVKSNVVGELTSRRIDKVQSVVKDLIFTKLNDKKCKGDKFTCLLFHDECMSMFTRAGTEAKDTMVVQL